LYDKKEKDAEAEGCVLGHRCVYARERYRGSTSVEGHDREWIERWYVELNFDLEISMV
jgi:hypothetical protein